MVCNESQDIREFKRSALQKSGDWYMNATQKISIGTHRERQIIRSNVYGRILDVGSGTGRISTYLKNKGHDVFAIDISLSMLSHQKSQVPCTCGDAEMLPFPNETFDCVTATWVLLHFPNWADILAEFVRILKPQGRLMFEVSSKENLIYAQNFDTGVEKKYSTHQTYEAFVSVQEIELALQNLGASLDQAIPYDFFNSNDLLNILVSNDKTQEILGCIDDQQTQNFWLWVEDNVMGHMPPGLSHKTFIIGHKTLDAVNHKPSAVISSLDELTTTAVNTIKEKSSLLLAYCIEQFTPGSVIWNLYRKIALIIMPLINIDIISLSRNIDTNTWTASDIDKINALINDDFIYFIETFTTTWHSDKAYDHAAICGIPCGPVIEYDLMQSLMATCTNDFRIKVSI